MERKTYSTYETGRSEPGLKIIGKLIKILGIQEEVIGFLMEQTVPREKSHPINLKQPDLSPEQVPALLYGAMKELVKATQEIAKNTRKELPEVLDKVHAKRKDKLSEKDKKSRPGA